MGHPREADAAPVPDQQVREAAPVLTRDEAHEVALDLDGALLSRQPKTLRETADVRVDDDPLWSAELGRHDIRGLARDAGQANELLERARNLAAVLLDQHLHRPTQRLRLLAEESGCVDVALELLGRHGEVVLRPAVLLEQHRRDTVDVHVGRLRRQHHRDEELQRVTRPESDFRVRMRLLQPLDDRPDASAFRTDALPRLVDEAAWHGLDGSECRLGEAVLAEPRPGAHDVPRGTAGARVLVR